LQKLQLPVTDGGRWHLFWQREDQAWRSRQGRTQRPARMW